MASSSIISLLKLFSPNVKRPSKVIGWLGCDRTVSELRWHCAQNLISFFQGEASHGGVSKGLRSSGALFQNSGKSEFYRTLEEATWGEGRIGWEVGDFPDKASGSCVPGWGLNPSSTITSETLGKLLNLCASVYLYVLVRVTLMGYFLGERGNF